MVRKTQKQEKRHTKTMKKFLSIALFAAIGSASFANSTSDGDVLFNLLKREVNYYYSHLSKDSVPVNQITLNVLQEKGVTIQSDMGYATVNETNWRRLSPIMRIGKTESYQGRNGSVIGNQNDLPLTNDTTVIKDVIWNALCDKYNALKKNLKSSKDEEEDTAQCTITIEPEKYYEAPLPEYNVDMEKWKALLNRITLTRKDSIKAVCRAEISYTDQRKYLVKSDGTEIVSNNRTFWVSLTASVKDKKEIELPMFKNFFAYKESDLPDENTLRETMVDLIERAYALSKAPMAEAYSGPVLFSGEAGGVFFHEVLGHRLEKDDSEFKPMVGKNVISSGISVTCDPTLKELNGTPLDGYYLYDDEGTKAQRVECIKDGVMKNFLHVLPQKSKDAPSNGHGRAAFGNKPIPRQSNLLVETSKPCTEEQLRQMFVQQLKESDKEFGYYIRTVSNGWTTTSNNTNRVSSFNVVPVETYKIYADGRPDSLVRGVSFIGTPLTAFSNIKAAGGKIETQNGRCGAQSGWVPVSITAPMIYVSQMETQRIKKGGGEKPVLAEPEFLPKEQLSGMSTDSIIFRAMEDEMNRSMDSLKQKDGTKPYFVDYKVYRTASAHVRSSLGSCEVYTRSEIKNTGKVYALVGNAMKMDMNYCRMDEMPDEVSYNHLRKELWEATFYAFDEAYDDYKSRKEWRAQEFLDDSIPEWPKMPGGNFIGESALSNYQKDTETLKQLVDTLSTVFKDYPELSDTRISGRLDYEDVYRLTSDGLRLRTPIKNVRIYGNASYITPDGKAFSERPQFRYCDVDDLPPLNSLIAEVREFASNLINMKNVQMSEEEEYIGPVLFEDERARSALYHNTFGEKSLYNYIHCNLNLGNRKYDSSYKQLGKRVACKDISLWQLGNDSVYNGHRLYGYRRYDADGIRPATVELIRNGVLVNQLAGRMPSPKALKSTGNEWMLPSEEYGYENVLTRAVHRISFDNAMSRKKLVKKFISMAREQHLEYAYILGGKGVRRVDTKTGKEEYVRVYGYSANPSRLQLMGDIWASKEETVDYIESVIHPKSILFPLLEMKVSAIDSKKCERFVELRH